jgi:hypothetical protein
MQSSLRQDALAAVQHFLDAEASGLDTSIALRVHGCENNAQSGGDAVLPTASATLLGAASAGDTIRVRVRYDLVGRAYIGQRSRFMPLARVDTVTFNVAGDSLGTPRILCGAPTPNHWSMATVDRFAASFDAASKDAWSRARAKP